MHLSFAAVDIISWDERALEFEAIYLFPHLWLAVYYFWETQPVCAKMLYEKGYRCVSRNLQVFSEQGVFLMEYFSIWLWLCWLDFAGILVPAKGMARVRIALSPQPSTRWACNSCVSKDFSVVGNLCLSSSLLCNDCVLNMWFSWRYLFGLFAFLRFSSRVNIIGCYILLRRHVFLRTLASIE